MRVNIKLFKLKCDLEKSEAGKKQTLILLSLHKAIK